MAIVLIYMCNKKASIYELNWKIYSISHASNNIFDGFNSNWYIHLQVGDSKDFSIEKKIGGSILTSMTELIFNSFLFKNFLAIPLEIPFDKLLHTNRNPYQINYVRSAIFHLEKKHNIFSISLTHKKKKNFNFPHHSLFYYLYYVYKLLEVNEKVM